MVNNEKTRAAAKAALEAYTQALDGNTLDEYDPQTAMVDLLADLHHLADAEPDTMDFDEACVSAGARYGEELIGSTWRAR